MEESLAVFVLYNVGHFFAVLLLSNLTGTTALYTQRETMQRKNNYIRIPEGNMKISPYIQ